MNRYVSVNQGRGNFEPRSLKYEICDSIYIYILYTVRYLSIFRSMQRNKTFENGVIIVELYAHRLLKISHDLLKGTCISVTISHLCLSFSFYISLLLFFSRKRKSVYENLKCELILMVIDD